MPTDSKVSKVFPLTFPMVNGEEDASEEGKEVLYARNGLRIIMGLSPGNGGPPWIQCTRPRFVQKKMNFFLQICFRER